MQDGLIKLESWLVMSNYKSYRDQCSYKKKFLILINHINLTYKFSFSKYKNNYIFVESVSKKMNNFIFIYKILIYILYLNILIFFKINYIFLFDMISNSYLMCILYNTLNTTHLFATIRIYVSIIFNLTLNLYFFCYILYFIHTWYESQ